MTADSLSEISHPPHESRTRVGVRWTWAIPVFILVLGAGIRLYGISNESAWMDELASYKHLNESSLRDFLHAERGSDPAMVPTYFVLAYTWSRLFGTSLVTMRLLSVCFSVGAMILLYRLARDIYGRTAAALTLFCMAMSPIHIYYAQEVRMYEFIFLVALVSAVFFRDALVHDRPRSWALFIAACVMLMWTHLFANFLLVAYAITLLVTRNYRRRGVYAWVAVCAVSAAGMVVWLLSIDRTAISTASHWMPRPTLRTAREFFLYAWGLPVGSWPQYLAYDRSAIILALIGGLIYLGWTAFTPARTETDRQQLRNDYVLLLSWLLIPPMLLGVFSAVATPAFVTRYAQYNTLAGFILMGGIATSPKWKSLRIGAVVMIVLVYGSAAWTNTRLLPMRGDWQSATSAVLAAHRPQDPVCCVEACKVTRRAIDYYLGREGFQALEFKDADQIWTEVNNRSNKGLGAWVIFGENMEDYVHQKRLSDLLAQHPMSYTLEHFSSARGVIWVYHFGG